MPELPDVEVYVDCLRRRIVGRTCERVRLIHPFVLRSVSPPLDAVEGQTITGVDRLGKRIVLSTSGDLFVVIHLMVAGRVRWRESGVKIPKKQGLAAFDFQNGMLLLTEAGSTRRASIHVVEGRRQLQEHDRGGLEVLNADLDAFRTALQRENHTLKRALTDPRLFSGIGNAYSDEILHAARLSPFALTQKLKPDEVVRLFRATRETLTRWLTQLRAEVGDGFPEKVTAFRQGMAVHGQYRRPCPVCGSPVQRIVYTTTEANYCARCQTGGTILADRALSRLLKNDWPRTL